jgi:hypothetical protein
MGKEVDYGRLSVGKLVRVDVDVVDQEYGIPWVKVEFRSLVTGVSRAGSHGAMGGGPLELAEVRFENGVTLHGSFGSGIRLYRTTRKR